MLHQLVINGIYQNKFSYNFSLLQVKLQTVNTGEILKSLMRSNHLLTAQNHNFLLVLHRVISVTK